MTLPTSAFEPTSNDFRLVEEAIRRVAKTAPVAEHHGRRLQTTLFGELSRGRRDLFTLVRAGRRALEEG